MKKILSVLLVLGMLISIAGCGEASQPTASGEQLAESQAQPTQEATKPTQAPTQETTQAPTQEPTQEPTQAPTQEPTQAATQNPTQESTQATDCGHQGAQWVQTKAPTCQTVGEQQLKCPSCQQALEVRELEKTGLESDPIRLEHLTVYYLYRWWLKAACDGDLWQQAAAAVVSVLCIAGLAKTTDNLKEASRMYAKEVEHCEENLNLLRKAMGLPQFSRDRLLAILEVPHAV